MCVMDFINKPDDTSGDKRKLAEIGIRSLLKMMLVDNFIHADLHPGNLLVCTKDSPSLFSFIQSEVVQPQLILLDVGMTTELKKDDQLNVISFFRAITQKDGEGIAKCVLLLSTNGCEVRKRERALFDSTLIDLYELNPLIEFLAHDTRRESFS